MCANHTGGFHLIQVKDDSGLDAVFDVDVGRTRCQEGTANV